MIALILAELTNWNFTLGRRTLTILICCSTLAGFLFTFNPEYYFWVMLIAFVWIGLSIGERGGTDILPDIRVGDIPLKRHQLILGEITAALIISLIHIVVLSPVAILFTFLWGVPGIVTGKAGLLFVMIAVVCASFRIFIKRIKERRSGRWDQP
jgi:TctA family transporter